MASIVEAVYQRQFVSPYSALQIIDRNFSRLVFLDLPWYRFVGK